ncbi:HvfC family RiPP maturation protein [Shewanella zhangzhouensis]|uniref:HvfC family RiPP maturation protein n=1 Tax=Shewanella zhangzhouensis TaxID=2864213 RepID=UPI001C65A5BF|nr:putative DNA-binding domain-containing protein [Shewanella zhangzhouensis]QYK06570.1 putative DNA-binding domain-containing protein [Shewanella zhangzhouensis]
MSFKDIQADFIEAIRRPDLPCPYGIAPQRMGVYRELFFNNVSGFVNSAFPVLKSLYGDAQWQALLRQFFIEHDCQNPLFIGIAGEFLAFLSAREPLAGEPPFLLELAHYEWLELVVATAVEQGDEAAFDDGALAQKAYLQARLGLASHARVAQYHFEVEKISPQYQPDSPLPSPCYFCLYRDGDDEVSFLKLNPMTAQLLAVLEVSTGIEYTELLQKMQALYPNFDGQQLREGIAQVLGQMAVRGVVVQKL